MRQSLFVGASQEAGETVTDIFTRIDGWEQHTATTVKRVLKILMTAKIDTIFFDLSAPIRGLNKLIAFVAEKFPETYRIILRNPRYDVKHRPMLEQSHSSFEHPASLVDFRRILLRIEQFCPVEGHSTTISAAADNEDYIYLLYDLLLQRDTAVGHVSALILKSEVLTKTVLQRINSPHYGLSQPVKTVVRAVQLIGVNGIREILDEQYSTKIAELQVA